MTIDPYILAFSALTVIATIWVGFWSAKKSKTASDFYVAGRTVSVGWNASAISGEYLSAASFMGVAGMVMSSGYDALWYPVCYACGYLFLLLFIAGPLRRFGAYTIPDFAEGRFDSPLFRKIAVVFVLFIGFFYTMPQMKGAGTTLSYIFQDLDFRGTAFAFLAPHEKGEALKGLHYGVGVFLVGAVITLNVALGGMKGITLVQAFQYWLKMFAISVPIFVLMAVYGHYGEHLKINSSEPRPSDVDPLKSFDRTYRFVPVEPTKWGLKRDPDLNERLADLLDTAMRTLNRFKKPAEGPITLSWNSMPLDDALVNYESLAQRPVVKLRELSGPPISVQVTNASSPSALAAVEIQLRERGVALIPFRDHVIVAVPSAITNRIVSYLKESITLNTARAPLPVNAPKDATWLNPFGPLTTKAAKAVKGRVNYSGILNQNQFGDFSSPDLVEKVQKQIIERRATLSLPVASYSAQKLLFIWANRQSKIDLRWSPALTNLMVDWQGPATLQATDTDALHKTLEQQGVTLISESNHVLKAFPTKDAVIVPVDLKPYALLYTYSLIIALVCGTAGLPHILVRFYTNPDGVAAKRTTMWVMILIGVFYLFPPVFGVMGRNLLPELYAATGAKGTDKVVLELPRILNQSTINNSQLPITNSTSAQSRSDSLRIENLELKIENSKRGIPWGSILSGITCAGAFAAFMSTFSGLLVSLTGALAHDVYGRMLNPKSTPDQRMRMFKVCAVLCGGGAILLGFFVETFEINKMVGWAFAIAATSYFPLLFLSTWWRGVTMKGAATGMLVGGTFSLVAIASTMFADQAPWAKWLADFYAGHPLLRILAEQPAIWALPLAIGLMIAISRLTKQEVPSDIRLKMLVLHAPEKLGLKQEYIQEHQHGH